MLIYVCKGYVQLHSLKKKQFFKQAAIAAARWILVI